MLRTMHRYPTLPAFPAHGPMPPQVSVIIPIARTNLVTNPSIEIATTGWTAVGGSVARSAAQQYHGTYSLAITPTAATTDGAYYGPITLTAGVVYAFSCKVLGIAGVPYKISIATTGAADLSVYQFIGTGRWQWVWGYYLESSTTGRRFYITKNNSTNAGLFYVDGVQVEAINTGELVSTYIDGDQPGLLVGQQPPAYLWTGAPHASTSTRSALTRAGGYLMNLQDAYNFLLTGIIGLGMAVPNNVSIPYTVLDGARYLRTTKPPRTFSLPGRFQADGQFELLQSLSAMRAAVDRDLTGIQQPMVLQIEPRDECGTVIGDFAQIQCLYAGGLEGNETHVPMEDAAPTFTMYLPYLVGGSGGAELAPNINVVSANAIVQRTPATGFWQALDSGMSGGTPSVLAMVYGLDGTLYAGGNFTNAGTSGADYLAKWDGSLWSVVKSATSMTGPVNALAVGPDGRIYIGGDFVNADGIAAADYIVVYDPVANTYAALGTGGASTGVNGLAFDTNGNLYATGAFTGMGGVANTQGIAMWDGTAWSSIGGDMAGGAATGYALAGDNQGNMYIAGDFTLIGATAISRVGKWNGSAWSQLSTGLNGKGFALALGPDGSIYAGGHFTTAGGAAATYIARWNGTGWYPLGSGFDNDCYDLAFAADGGLYASGAFTTANGVTLPDRAARWNGSAWTPIDIDVPGTLITAILAAPDGSLNLGFNTSGTAVAAVSTPVTNSAPGLVYPIITIDGSLLGAGATSRVYQIVNYTTGIGVWFNLTIHDNEVVTLNFNPQNPSYRSSFLGDITNTILPGSQPSLFYLAPGINQINFFSASNLVTPTISWQKRYNGTADLVN